MSNLLPDIDQGLHPSGIGNTFPCPIMTLTESYLIQRYKKALFINIFRKQVVFYARIFPSNVHRPPSVCEGEHKPSVICDIIES